MSVGKGPPRAVAVKAVPDDELGAAERVALALVSKQLQGKAGPHHITSLLEAMPHQDA